MTNELISKLNGYVRDLCAGVKVEINHVEIRPLGGNTFGFFIDGVAHGKKKGAKASLLYVIGLQVMSA